ncbi:hypothetical protein J2X65_003211 [Ancylobacter sp. 3268]|uniref:hypothetical protein n=1 Tax=Ancylobacter sp. 3268 TaxID=2817752 RepID=UPI0028664520|nr:hypothetical protein [Ancylobacter sp. 3268]MDR6953848.1 hypothetical protein [Ancylobacter sp. 3268]
MTTATQLSDAQWCFLDLLVRSKQRGASRVNRHELLYSSALPAVVRMRLVFAGLTMPAEFVVIHGQHDFELTEAGQRLYDLRFGRGAEPASATSIADRVIALPDLTGGTRG